MESEPNRADAESAAVYVRTRYEYVDLELLGMDPQSPVATETLSFSSALLGAIALSPESCQLVVTGDFVESVKQRLPRAEYRDGFDIARGAGLVGGKTMRVGEEVHVLLPATLFITDTATIAVPGSSEEPVTFVQAFGLSNAEVRDKIARRTVLHEAQHVAMIQAGEDVDPSEDEPWVHRNFLTVANQVISEYRAERAVPADLRDADDEQDALSGLLALRADFHRIAAVEYQDHLDVARLQYGIVQESHTAWKVLAYFAAARRVAGIPVEQPVSSRLADTDEWSMMAAPHWDRFEELLADLPPGTVRVDIDELARVTTALADLFPAWLGSFGFLWRDVGDNSEFRIQSWDLIL